MPEKTLLVEELLQLVESARAAERPAYALAGIEHRRGLSDGKIETGNGLDVVSALVEHHDGATLTSGACIICLGNKEQLVDRIDRDSGAAVNLICVARAGRAGRQ